jgi:hypothetical protein
MTLPAAEAICLILLHGCDDVKTFYFHDFKHGDDATSFCYTAIITPTALPTDK